MERAKVDYKENLKHEKEQHSEILNQSYLDYEGELSHALEEHTKAQGWMKAFHEEAHKKQLADSDQ